MLSDFPKKRVILGNIHQELELLFATMLKGEKNQPEINV